MKYLNIERGKHASAENSVPSEIIIQKGRKNIKFLRNTKRNLSPVDLPCLKSSKKFFREKGNELDQTLGFM